MQHKPQHKKQVSQGNRRRKILPVVFVLLSLLLMALPLESPVASVKAFLAYIFIPQIRASHAALEYAQGVSGTVRELLNTHWENERLQEEMDRLRLENAQAREVFAENERLRAALGMKPSHIWRGVWTKTAYREPTQWNSVIIDKGTQDGVQERAAAVALKDGEPVLAGVVVETDDYTAKVLLVRDEDFSAAAVSSSSGKEGLLVGAGAAPLKMLYLPLLSSVERGEKVYTSASSSIFPAGILVGEVVQSGEENSSATALTARVEPAADASSIRELFILLPKSGGNTP